MTRSRPQSASHQLLKAGERFDKAGASRAGERGGGEPPRLRRECRTVPLRFCAAFLRCRGQPGLSFLKANASELERLWFSCMVEPFVTDQQGFTRALKAAWEDGVRCGKLPVRRPRLGVVLCGASQHLSHAVSCPEEEAPVIA